MTTTTARPAARLRTTDMAYIALFAVGMAVCAWVSVPMAVPFTLQTFGVFLALGALGGRRGTWAVAVYLLLGAVGLPVFSGFQGGLGALLGATGGYLLGFLAAALVYWLVTAKLGTSRPAEALAMALGLAVCYAFGTAWFLAVYARTTGPIGLAAALSWCVVPFLLPDLIKLALAAALSRRLGRFLK